MPEPAARGRNPFDMSGVTRGPDGLARYTGRPDSLVHMLRATVQRDPDGLAVAEIGGDRVSYRELWERAALVAGGLRAHGVQPGERVAIRLPNGLDWVLAFWGSQLAGAVAVPVNTRFKGLRGPVRDRGLGGVVRVRRAAGWRTDRRRGSGP